jgi:predicted RNA binding protein YcfA (HicA-like mRNA interferase family)
MPSMPRVTAREIERALLRDGWYAVGTGGGSHRQYRHETKLGRVTLPFHAGQIIVPKTLSTILQQAGLTVEQFRQLL